MTFQESGYQYPDLKIGDSFAGDSFLFRMFSSLPVIWLESNHQFILSGPLGGGFFNKAEQALRANNRKLRFQDVKAELDQEYEVIIIAAAQRAIVDADKEIKSNTCYSCRLRALQLTKDDIRSFDSWSNINSSGGCIA